MVDDDFHRALRDHVQRRVRVEFVVFIAKRRLSRAFALEITLRLGRIARLTQHRALALGPPLYHALPRKRHAPPALPSERRAVVVRQRVEDVILVQERADAGEELIALEREAFLVLLLPLELALALLASVARRLPLGGGRRAVAHHLPVTLRVRKPTKGAEWFR